MLVRRAAFAAIVSGVFATSCSSTPQSPIGPSTTQAGQPIPAPTGVSGPSSASLAIEDAFVLVHRYGTFFGYDVRFLLRETGGRSGATVTDVAVSSPGGSDHTGPSCWIDSLRVPPGGTLDTFHTDAGRAWLVYCAPGTNGSTPNPRLDVEVSFADDEGRSASVTTFAVTVR